MNSKFELIKKYLKKKKEEVIIDLIIKDYDKSNFYIALVFNRKIDKFKVLFIPMDILEDDKIDEYCCYQFIMLSNVNYILEILNEDKELFNDEFRNKLSDTLKSYYIEINTSIDNNDYKFITNQFIPKEWEFMFEIMVILFEHCPNIVNELCTKLLVDFNSKEDSLRYDYSLEMDIFGDSLGLIEGIDVNNIDFLEKINDKYYAVIEDNIFVLEYNSYKKILNIYSDTRGEVNVQYLYAIISAIRNKLEKKFYKISVIEDEIKTNYLCYGLDDNGSFKVIENNSCKLISFDLMKNNSIIFNDKLDDELKNKIDKYMKME